MRHLSLLTLVFFSFGLYSQDTITKACYFTSMKEYINNEPSKIAYIMSESSTEISFYYQYTKMTLSSKSTWGYLNNAGELYRSIDMVFYKLLNVDDILVYRLESDGEVKYKVSMGINMYPMDLNEDNVAQLISSNKALLKMYLDLSKKERNINALQYVLLYNEQALASK